MDDEDLRRAARLFLRRHGDGAKMALAQRIDRARAQGDPYAAMMWRRVVKLIRELEHRPGADRPLY